MRYRRSELSLYSLLCVNFAFVALGCRTIPDTPDNPKFVGAGAPLEASAHMRLVPADVALSAPGSGSRASGLDSETQSAIFAVLHRSSNREDLDAGPTFKQAIVVLEKEDWESRLEKAQRQIVVESILEGMLGEKIDQVEGSDALRRLGVIEDNALGGLEGLGGGTYSASQLQSLVAKFSRVCCTQLLSYSSEVSEAGPTGAVSFTFLAAGSVQEVAEEFWPQNWGRCDKEFFPEVYAACVGPTCSHTPDCDAPLDPTPAPAANPPTNGDWQGILYERFTVADAGQSNTVLKNSLKITTHSSDSSYAVKYSLAGNHSSQVRGDAERECGLTKDCGSIVVTPGDVEGQSKVLITKTVAYADRGPQGNKFTKEEMKLSLDYMRRMMVNYGVCCGVAEPNCPLQANFPAASGNAVPYCQ